MFMAKAGRGPFPEKAGQAAFSFSAHLGWELTLSIAPENLQNWVAALNTHSPETLPSGPGGLLKQALVQCTEVVQASGAEGLSIQTAPQVLHQPKLARDLPQWKSGKTPPGQCHLLKKDCGPA